MNYGSLNSKALQPTKSDFYEIANLNEKSQINPGNKLKPAEPIRSYMPKLLIMQQISIFDSCWATFFFFLAWVVFTNFFAFCPMQS